MEEHKMVATQPPTKLQPQIIKDIYMCGKNATYMDDNQQINKLTHTKTTTTTLKLRKKKRERNGEKR